MMKLLHQKILQFLFIIFLSLSPQLWGQGFTGAYEFTGSGNNVSSFPYNGDAIQNLTVGPLTKNGITSSSSSGAFRASNWNQLTTPTTSDYFEFTITAAAGYTISNPSITFGFGRSTTGPRSFQWRSNIDNYTALIPFTNVPSGSNVSNTVTTSASSNVNGYAVALSTSGKTTITFRFYGFNSTATTGTGGLYGSLTFDGTLVASAALGTINTTSLTDFGNVIVGNTSASQNFTIANGTGITGANAITATAPTHFEVSLDNTAFSQNVSFDNPASGSTKTVYVRFAPTSAAPAGPGISNSITISATNAPNKTVGVTGNKVTAPVINSVLTDTSTYGSTDTYAITTSTGTAPLLYYATISGGALPAGATLSGNTISFTSTFPAGTYNIDLKAENSYGSNTKTLVYTRNKKALTLTGGSAQGREYDSTTTVTLSTPLSLSGIVSGDDVTITGNEVANLVNKNAGSQQVTITGGYTLAGSEADNYSLTLPQSPSGLTAVITKKQLTVTGIIAENKIYNGVSTAAITGTALVSGVIFGDVGSLNTTAVAAAFNDANVAAAKTVTVSGYTLTGTDAINYTVQQPSLSADITAKELTISGIQINNKPEDGNNAATITGTAALDGIINPDVVTLNGSGATASFADAAIGTNKPVTVAGYTLSGANAANYTLQQPQGLTANITDITLQDQTITFSPLTNATYGDADFALTATASSNLTVTYISSDTSVATVNGNMITVVGVGTTTITAQQVGDGTHNPAPAVTQNLTINKKALTVINTVVTAKTYDKTTTAQVSGTLSGVIGSENVLLVSGTGTFVTDDAGTGIAITTQFSITGTDAGNYTITQPVTTGTITPAALTLTNPAANNKAYNGTTAAIITGTLSGILSGDTVTLSGSGTFATSAVGTGIVVTSTSTLAGTDSSNYTLTQPTGLTANITGLVITVTATAANKVYDKTTDAVITVTQTNGAVTGDDVTVTGGGTFNNATTGTNKTVTANLTLSGTAAGNYTVTQPTGLTAAITPKAVTIDTSNTTVTTKAYNGSTAAQLNNTTITGLVAGDETNVSASTGTFAQTTPGTGIVVNNISLTGTAATNYSLTQPSALTGDITPAVITFSGVAAIGKAYDGNTTASIAGNLAGKVGSDAVTYIGTGTFASKNVGTAIPVTANVTLTGANASYYTIVQPTGLSATITRKSLTVTATPQNKVYDRTTAATVTNAVITTGGIITGDDASLSSTTATGTFANYNVGLGINVTSLFALQGADAANYNVASQIVGTANITPLTITADITNAVVTKQYSNTNTAVTAGVTLVGYIPADVPGLQAVQGTYASVLPGVNIPVTIVLSGSNAANYSLTQPGLTGTITKRMLTVTAVNKTKVQGTANPALTFTVSNFASGESAANAAGYIAPTINTTAEVSSPLGTYPIAVAEGSADNYEFTLVNGWIMINPPVNTVFNPGTLWSNNIDGTNPSADNPYILGQTIPASSYISVSGVGRGSGISGVNANSRYAASSWDTTFDPNNYFYFTIIPQNGYKINFTNFAYTGQVSSNNPPNQFAIKSSVDNYTATIGTASAIGEIITLTSAAYQNISTPITFRLYAWGGTNAGATFSVNDFSFNGSIAQIPVTTAPAITSTLTDTSVIGTTDTYQITATGTPALALSAENLPAGAAVNASGLISFDGTTPAGQYTIALMAESYYGSDSKNLVYTVSKKDQAVTFNPDPIPAKFLNEAPFVVTATNNVPLAVTYASSNTAVATIAQDGTISITGVGTTVITASNTGDAIYNAVSISRNFTVLPTPLLTASPASIAFTAIQGQGPSAAAQLASISGIDLSPAAGNLTLTASSGFEIAMGIGNYGSTATFGYTTGAVNQTNPQIYVRLAAGHAQGTYNGTLTITGGNATFTITLNGTVEFAPAVTTTATAFGPYCFGSENTISVPYTTQGTFASGSYYVQLSDNAGVFPNDFSNTISAAATSSPIAATLPATLTAGNYRVRVIHLSTGLTLTSSINSNGSNIVINITPAPTAAALTFCNAKTVANLTATGTDLKWYATANSTTALATTDAIASGNYYVSQTLNGCESARTEVAVIVNITPAPTAAALTFCNAKTVANLTATGTDLKWYATANSTTALATTDAIASGNYYVSQTLNGCESAKTEVAVIVNITPVPTVAALTFCNAKTVANLTATGTDLKWYATANSTTALATTDAIASGNYYVSQTLNGCESAKTQVAVIVNITPAPVAVALTFNQGATVADFTATGTDLKWYDTIIGGNELSDSSILISGSYFVSQTLNECESTRTEVIVTITTISTPAAPLASAQVFCNTAIVENLIAEGENLKWYTTANSTITLASTDVVVSGNYYVSQTINNVESDRTEVAITVNVTPAPVAVALTFNQGATVTDLTATGTDLKWYDTITGGNELSDGSLLVSGSYFVSQTLNECESTRIEVIVTITTISTPAAPLASAQVFCNTAIVENLIAEGENLKWYTTANSTITLASTDVVVSGNYYVSQTINNVESDRTEVTITVNVTPAPVAVAQTFCQLALGSNLIATGTGLKWYTAITEGEEVTDTTVLTSGNYYVSQTLNGCESIRTEVQVIITTTPVPEGETTQLFSEEGKTISNLEADGQNIKWYATEADALAQVNELADDTVLVSETTYYATQTINGCESKEVLAVTVTVTLGIDDVTKFSYKYYPNPVVDKLYIESAETVTNVTVYTLTGQEVINQKWNTEGGVLDVSSLQSAVYIVKIKFGTIEETIKMVKDKK